MSRPKGGWWSFVFYCGAHQMGSKQSRTELIKCINYSHSKSEKGRFIVKSWREFNFLHTHSVVTVIKKGIRELKSSPGGAPVYTGRRFIVPVGVSVQNISFLSLSRH